MSVNIWDVLSVLCSIKDIVRGVLNVAFLRPNFATYSTKLQFSLRYALDSYNRTLSIILGSNLLFTVEHLREFLAFVEFLHPFDGVSLSLD